MNANKWYAEGDRIFCNHKNGRWQVATVEYWQREETDRHAKLIAAAPDLLAALELFANLDRTVNSDLWAIDASFCDKARAAIAKATD